MRFSGARGITRSRVPLIAMLALAAFGLAGCEGDDGKDGAAGQPGLPGDPGPVGPEGPVGPPGPGATIEPRESCGVCHSDGAAYGVDVAHAVDPVPTVSAPVFAESGTDLVLSFNVKLDGVNATDFNAIGVSRFTGAQIAYQFANGRRNTLSAIDPTSPTDTTPFPGDEVTPVVLAGGTGGDYTLTITGGAIYAATDSRYMVQIVNPAGARAIVLGDSPRSPDESLVSSAGCSGCHGGTGDGFHYGYPASGATCTVCHNATNTNYPRLVDIGHGIHNAHGMPTGEFVLETVNGDRSWTYDTTYPTYMANCSVCHTADSGALAKANAMTVTPANCFSCHGSMASPDWDFTTTTFHNSFNESTDCSTCHNSTPGALAPATVAAFHNGWATERGGIIWDGVDTSVTEGAKFDWQITGIVDDGTNLAISWTAKYDGVDVNPCNATVGPGAPAFHAIPALPPVPPATNPTNRANLSMLRSYAQGDDFVLGQDANAPGQASAVNVTTTNTTCAGNVATTVIPVNTGVTATRGIVALQGKPWVVAVDPADSDGVMQVRAKTPTREWVVGTGALPAEPRRAIADTDACLTCHVGSLYQHGGNRVDNVDMCVLCHNSASSEQNIRVGMGVDASEAYDGKVGQTYEFKTMLHAIHSAGSGLAPIVIYRTRGIYAWAADESMLSNWPGASDTPIPVFGSDPAATTRLQAHFFHSPTYPRDENACGACHVAGFGTIPDQGQAVATTLDAGGTAWGDQLDDTLQGASAAACTSCHNTTDARGHAYQNGWTPQTFENGRQTILDTK